MIRLFVRHRFLVAALATSTLIGGVCAQLNTAGDLVVAAASTHVLIDYPDASIVYRSALPQDLRNLQQHAELYAQLMTTAPVLEAIGRRAGLPAGQISGVADVTGDVPVQFTQAGSEQHASELLDSRAPYRLELQADPTEPILAIYSEAPSLDLALRLANSAVAGLDDYLRSLPQPHGLPEREFPQARQLGTARGNVTNSSARIVIGALTFITSFALSFIILLLLVRRPWRRRTRPASRLARRPRLTDRAAADWPRTTRLLPWSVAGLITMFWLTPFDRIQLKVHSPVNITLDRIALPIIAVIWLIAFTAGPGAAPRLRLTRVHAAAGAFLACAFLSTVLDAHYLNHTGELMLSLKKLPLLLSFLLVFVIVASSVRRSEVPAFMTFTLVLAVIVALEVVYEFHSHRDLFVTLSTTLAKGPFELVDNAAGSIFDSQGRAWIQGPSAYGVELITMLSIALPIAVLRLLGSKRPKQYILYSLATVVLLYAMFATDRKSALIVPAAAFLTLAYYRRSNLVSLIPLGLVGAVIVIAVAPASVGNVLAQFTSANASHVATVSSRTANFDAIRPDLWTHLLFGRGQGTYAPPTDRIVDSEIILRLVETGVAGLVAFLLIPLAVVVIAHKTVSRRDARWSSPALCGAAAAVCFIVASALYSVMSLPHAPDVFMYVAGMTAAVVGPGEVSVEPPRARRREAFGGRRLRAPVHVGATGVSAVPRR